MDFNPALCDVIRQRIAQSPHRRITFAEYMDLVLYHPQHGYYATGAGKIGAPGDFFTSPHLGDDFGQLLAVQFVEMWEILGNPVPFQLLEMGAGQGLVAGDVLEYLHRHHLDFFEVLEYKIVEKSAAMRAYQQQRLSKWAKGGDRLRWCTWEEIPPGSITGCLFSNELVDAFPVHQFAIADGKLQEIYVTTNLSTDLQEGAAEESQFFEAMGEPSTPDLGKYFELLGIDLGSGAYADGYRSEVNLAALDWVSTVADRLDRGYLLTIDYGYPADRYYNRHRDRGTLQCYYQHKHHDNPYLYVGHQDITAHVNFTALERQGELCGLQQVGFTQQALFLMALGLGDRLAALSTDEIDLSMLLRRREQLHQLMDPMGLGGFGVLVQSKGLSEEERARSLKSLSMPPMR